MKPHRELVSKRHRNEKFVLRYLRGCSWRLSPSIPKARLLRYRHAMGMVKLKGYLTFVVVLVALVLIFSAMELSLAAKAFDLSKATAVERAYSTETNAKEAITETTRLAAIGAATKYDKTHDLESCRHCIDFLCSPPAPPPMPPSANLCDPIMCEGCFREPEMRKTVEEAAASAVSDLGKQIANKAAGRNNDFKITIPTAAAFKATTRPEPTAKNKVQLESIEFKATVEVVATSEKFGMTARTTIPAGQKISCGLETVRMGAADG